MSQIVPEPTAIDAARAGGRLPRGGDRALVGVHRSVGLPSTTHVQALPDPSRDSTTSRSGAPAAVMGVAAASTTTWPPSPGARGLTRSPTPVERALADVHLADVRAA